jgi:hypothetical protein
MLIAAGAKLLSRASKKVSPDGSRIAHQQLFNLAWRRRRGEGRRRICTSRNRIKVEVGGEVAGGTATAAAAAPDKP